MKIELKRISFSERNSEETNCFAADLYINNKKVGYAKNDGCGGCTNYYGDSAENNTIIVEAEKYCKALPKAKSEEFNFEYEQSLETVIDELLSNYLIMKEAKKKQKKYVKYFCYGKPNGYYYSTIGWKNKSLAEIPLKNLQETYNNIKGKLGEGEVIFNDNLNELGLIL